MTKRYQTISESGMRAFSSPASTLFTMSFSFDHFNRVIGERFKECKRLPQLMYIN